MRWPLSQDYNEAIQDPRRSKLDKKPILQALGQIRRREANLAHRE